MSRARVFSESPLRRARRLHREHLDKMQQLARRLTHESAHWSLQQVRAAKSELEELTRELRTLERQVTNLGGEL